MTPGRARVVLSRFVLGVLAAAFRFSGVRELSVTIIIAARPGQADVRAVDAARALDFPAERLEILLARGNQPSVQRNAALRAAHGDLIYFLDDDSVAAPGNLRRGVVHFESADVKMAGGPSLCPPETPALPQAFALAMGSYAFGPSCSRYRARGSVRASSEKELILCNLMARREDLLRLGGFNESLYPNEENALMDELQKRGGRLLYDPELIVHRPPRPNFRSFCRMLWNYGRGRAEQVRLHPTLRSAPNFVPPLICVFFAALPFLPGAAWWLAAIYFAAALGVSVAVVPGRKWFWAPWIMGLVFVSHIVYGLGFWRGCLKRPKPPGAEVAAGVKVETVRGMKAEG
jgi:glycosyltransferase involved in cell wall biosynthesis